MPSKNKTIISRHSGKSDEIGRIQNQKEEDFGQARKTIPKTGKFLVVSLAILIIALGLIFTLKNQFIVAWVNGQPVTRLELISELEKTSGKKTLDYLVTKTLIFQEAKKENVTVTDSEVNTQLKSLKDNITKSGQNYQALLDAQGITEPQLIEQIKIQKMVDKMAGKGITVSNAEVTDYINKNKDQLPKDVTSEELVTQVKNQLLQQKISEKTQTWLKALRDKAKIISSY